MKRKYAVLKEIINNCEGSEIVRNVSGHPFNSSHPKESKTKTNIYCIKVDEDLSLQEIKKHYPSVIHIDKYSDKLSRISVGEFYMKHTLTDHKIFYRISENEILLVEGN